MPLDPTESATRALMHYQAHGDPKVFQTYADAAKDSGHPRGPLISRLLTALHKHAPTTADKMEELLGSNPLLQRLSNLKEGRGFTADNDLPENNAVAITPLKNVGSIKERHGNPPAAEKPQAPKAAKAEPAPADAVAKAGSPKGASGFMR